jgi:hypothetical protein
VWQPTMLELNTSTDMVVHQHLSVQVKLSIRGRESVVCVGSAVLFDVSPSVD